MASVPASPGRQTHPPDIRISVTTNAGAEKTRTSPLPTASRITIRRVPHDPAQIQSPGKTNPVAPASIKSKTRLKSPPRKPITFWEYAANGNGQFHELKPPQVQIRAVAG